LVDKVRKRLTYANVMATVAVLVALGGSSYAALTINGAQLKNRSVRAIKIARNTLGGTEIRESALGKVPRARNADRLGGIAAPQLKIRCPSDTFPAADVCVERTARPAVAYETAVLECAQAGTPAAPGRRLPTHDELRAALTAVQLAPGGELTGQVYPSTSAPGEVDALFVTDQVGHVGVTPNTGAGAKPFRCVADPLN
jgi:hypothetical protein